MKLSLILPCYNEALSLPQQLERCKSVAAHPGAEVILVDNGSTDNTPEVLRDLLPKYPGCRSIRVEKNQGYGFGILAGLNASTGDILAWTHADTQTDPQDALKGLALFEAHGCDIFVKGKRHGRPLTDIIFTIGMSIFETLLLQKPLWDINAQPTMFSRTFFESWKNAPHDFSLDLYAYYQALHQALPVYRFPVLFGKREHGISHWNIDFASKIKFIKRTIAYSLTLKKSLTS